MNENKMIYEEEIDLREILKQFGKENSLLFLLP